MRDVERAADVGAEAREIVAGFFGLDAGERVGLRVKAGVVVGEIEEAVGLVDVEAAAEASDRDRAATTESTGAAEAAARSTAGAALGLSAGNESSGLRSLAKLFDAILQIFFAAAAEVLAAPLRAGDTDGFVGCVGSGATHG